LKQFNDTKITTENKTYNVVFRNTRSTNPTSQLVVQVPQDSIEEVIRVMEKLRSSTIETVKGCFSSQ
jgi:hypothetical protein